LRKYGIAHEARLIWAGKAMNGVIEEPKALLEGHWLVLIEDDPLLQSILSGFVEELGGRVSSFETADDALVHAQCR